MARNTVGVDCNQGAIWKGLKKDWVGDSASAVLTNSGACACDSASAVLPNAGPCELRYLTPYPNQSKAEGRRDTHIFYFGFTDLIGQDRR